MYINMLSDYLKTEYGCKLYKIILSSGMSCPNRVGLCGSRGCIFCSGGGSGEFAEDASLSIDKQIECGKKKLKGKSKKDKYIAYFQAFSNTFASPDTLNSLFRPIVLRDDIAILSIATRPDCLDDEKISLLAELNNIKPIWVELGLQTSNDTTADYIRRGYRTSLYIEIADKLRANGIHVITHLILGLPNESKEDMKTSSELAGKHSDGIKFHMLYILKNTDLGRIYAENKFRVLTRDEYIDILCDCIRLLPAEVVIHRLTGDAEKSQLIAPLWTSDKVTVLREIHNAFYDKNLIQGEFLNKRKRPDA